MNTAVQDEQRFAEPMPIGQIIDIMGATCYAVGATDVRTFGEDFMWYCNLTLEQRMAVSEEQHAIAQEAIRREELESIALTDDAEVNNYLLSLHEQDAVNKANGGVKCHLCGWHFPKAHLNQHDLCEQCEDDAEGFEQVVFADDEGRCSCPPNDKGHCHVCQFNGCYPGEGGPEYDDYPDGMCHGCHEIVGTENLVSGGCASCNHTLQQEELMRQLMRVASGVVAEHWPIDEEDDLPF